MFWVIKANLKRGEKMKRELDITVDLKVQQYSPIKLKQFDSTRINFKVINFGTNFSLQGLTSSLVFEKPDKKIVYQECTINEDTIIADLLENCLRQSGKANIELQILEGEDIVSTFKIPVTIEESAKENVESDNTPNYIEVLEDAIKEEKQRQENEKQRQKNETDREEAENKRISSEETREKNETNRTKAETTRNNKEIERKNAETIRQNNETTRISNEQDRVEAEDKRASSYNIIKTYVDNHAAITYKYKMILTDTIDAGAQIVLPFYYKVGSEVLDVFFRGERLLLSSDNLGTNGHYQEIGESASVSNTIKITEDWSCKIGDYFEFIVRGEYTNDT